MVQPGFTRSLPVRSLLANHSRLSSLRWPVCSAALPRMMVSGASPSLRRRAAGLVIGNEILNGSTLDTNTQVLGQFLFQRGVRLARVETVEDDKDVISEAAAKLAATHDYVFTSGGIGPTLDDVTYASLAQAFNTELELHDETVQRMKRTSPGMDLNSARLRMATLPADSVKLYTDGLWVPTVMLKEKSVFVLPGVPRLYKKMLHAIPADIVSGGDGISARVSAEVKTHLPEGALAALLEEVAAEYPAVALGSYPVDPLAGEPHAKSSLAASKSATVEYRTRLTVEGDEESSVAAAKEMLEGLLLREQQRYDSGR